MSLRDVSDDKIGVTLAAEMRVGKHLATAIPHAKGDVERNSPSRSCHRNRASYGSVCGNVESTRVDLATKSVPQRFRSATDSGSDSTSRTGIVDEDYQRG